MKLGLMQPYFFPYLGYFSLIAHVDKWIFFDTAQYIERGWINRNRVLKQDGTWKYITVPVENHKSNIAIKDVRIKEELGWQDRIIRQLSAYKKVAPYYQEVMKFIEKSFQYTTDNISELNAFLIQNTFEFLDMPFEYCYLSEMNLPLNHINGPDEWALEISKELGVSDYINAPGGKKIFNKEKFKQAGIGLKYLNPQIIPYAQNGHCFIGGLSIIDVLMFNSKEQTRQLIHNYRIE